MVSRFLTYSSPSFFWTESTGLAPLSLTIGLPLGRGEYEPNKYLKLKVLIKCKTQGATYKEYKLG